MKLWVSRDKVGYLYLSNKKPLYDGADYYGVKLIHITDYVDDEEFKHITFENSPLEVELVANDHPKEIGGCDFCKQERFVTHRSKECDLSYDGEALCADVDIPLTWGSATGYYGFDINYCPMCGRKLK